MATRLGKFELPNRLIKEDDTSTDTYAKFIADPFESGYGHTIGNAFRRVLLSSIEGAAISSLKLDGIQHEFQSIDGVVEDVTVNEMEKSFTQEAVETQHETNSTDSVEDDVSNDLKEFGVDSDSPDLFSSETENSSPDDLLSSDEEEEDDLEIPAFLRRQKN